MRWKEEEEEHSSFFNFIYILYRTWVPGTDRYCCPVYILVELLFYFFNTLL